MGVKHLWDMLESCKKTLPLHQLQDKRLCIDLSCWIVQLQNANKSHAGVKDKLYLKGLFHRLRALISLNCTLIFVADGSIPAIKLATYKRRLNGGTEVTNGDTNSQKVTSLRRNMGSDFSRMIKEAKVLGMALGIPCLDGKEEAEAQCALLNLESLCDGCFSSDSDVFLFGARTVYRDICLGEGGHVVCYEMADIERKLGFGRNSLITLALLLGSDYSHGVHGLGPESACQVVKSVQDDEILQRITSEGLSFVKKKKCSKKQMQILNSNKKPSSVDSEVDIEVRSGNNIEEQNQFLQVIDAYLKPKCHLADSVAVYRVLSQHTFQRIELQQICAQFFEWPPEKTDEYILPKIAERDLRRFANLRSTSSAQGVMLPLDKMPVKCPVSGIVKRRKVLGKECFEVAWAGLDGLQSSIVPADLIESACPEKIAEFEMQRALGKRQNNRKQRTKKSEKTSSVQEIDSKLQNLLLDIEYGSDNTLTASQTRQQASEETAAATTVRFKNQGSVSILSESTTDCDTAISHCSSSNLAAHEVIDLLSPAPPARSAALSRCQEVNDHRIEVIELSESENEMSPEHMRKAKELRLFMASIRDNF